MYRFYNSSLATDGNLGKQGIKLQELIVSNIIYSVENHKTLPAWMYNYNINQWPNGMSEQQKAVFKWLLSQNVLWFYKNTKSNGSNSFNCFWAKQTEKQSILYAQRHKYTHMMYINKQNLHGTICFCSFISSGKYQHCFREVYCLVHSIYSPKGLH